MDYTTAAAGVPQIGARAESWEGKMPASKSQIIARVAEGVVRQAEPRFRQNGEFLFSSGAETRIIERTAQYLVDLTDESVRVAERHQADAVSAGHVRGAEEHLATKPRSFFRHLGALGGILLGASLSNFLSILGAGGYSPAATVIWVAVGFVGVFFIALHFAHD